MFVLRNTEVRYIKKFNFVFEEKPSGGRDGGYLVHVKRNNSDFRQDFVNVLVTETELPISNEKVPVHSCITSKIR